MNQTDHLPQHPRHYRMACPVPVGSENRLSATASIERSTASAKSLSAVGLRGRRCPFGPPAAFTGERTEYGQHTSRPRTGRSPVSPPDRRDASPIRSPEDAASALARRPTMWSSLYLPRLGSALHSILFGRPCTNPRHARCGPSESGVRNCGVRKSAVGGFGQNSRHGTSTGVCPWSDPQGWCHVTRIPTETVLLTAGR